MSRDRGRIFWRWEEKDYGFRFRSGKGKSQDEYYQAAHAGEFYIVPKSNRKLATARADQLASAAPAPTSPRVVVMPWQNYDREWQWIETTEGILLNFAGCLDLDEIHRREDQGVARAMEYVTRLLDRAEPVPLSITLLQQIHRELMGDIYPFAGEWRTVALHKGTGPTKWPLPPSGIEPLMQILERDVLSRSPVVFESDEDVFSFASEVMNEVIAIHPFREGNGRAAFILVNQLLMQNGLLPLNDYDRRNDEARYYAACEAGRINKNYRPLAGLLAEWSEAAVARWAANHE